MDYMKYCFLSNQIKKVLISQGVGSVPSSYMLQLSIWKSVFGLMVAFLLI